MTSDRKFWLRAGINTIIVEPTTTLTSIRAAPPLRGFVPRDKPEETYTAEGRVVDALDDTLLGTTAYYDPQQARWFGSLLPNSARFVPMDAVLGYSVTESPFPVHLPPWRRPSLARLRAIARGEAEPSEEEIELIKIAADRFLEVAR